MGIVPFSVKNKENIELKQKLQLSSEQTCELFSLPQEM
jgi:hypothetical protein